MLHFPDTHDEAAGVPLIAHEADWGRAPPVTLTTLLDALRRRAWMVPVFGLLVLTLGVLVSAFYPAKYLATAQLVVDPIELNLVQNGLMPGGQSADAGVSISETQAHIISSDNVLRRVVAKLHLDREGGFIKHTFWRDGGALEATMLFLGAATPDADADPMLIALDTLRRSIGVSRTERTFVIDASVKTPDPVLSANIANALTEAYLEDKAAAHAEVARRAADSLKGRLNELRTDAHDAEEAVVKYRRDNNLVGTEGHLPVEQEVIELTTELAKARVRVAEARTHLADSGGTAAPELARAEDVRAMRQQLADLTRQQADMTLRFGPDHPAMRQMQAQIVSLRGSLGATSGRVVGVNRDEYERAAAAERSLAGSLDEARARLGQDDLALVTMQELQRDADSRRSVYDLFVGRARETREQAQLDTSNARVISVAVPARKRSFPPSPMTLLPLSLTLGLMLGAALAIARGLPGAQARTVAGAPGRALVMPRSGELA